jgi:SNF2 family DNA or RNA helicase
MHVSYYLKKASKESLITVAVTIKNNEGVLHADKRFMLTVQDKKIVEALIKDFNTFKPLKLASLENGKIDQVVVSDKVLNILFTELAKVKEVYFENKKIIIDALSYARLFYEVTLTQQEALIDAYVIDGTRKIPLSEIEAYFGLDSTWILHKGVLKKLKQDVKWLKLGLEGSVLTGKKREDLLDYENELPLDSSVPEAKFSVQKSKAINPTPLLVLKNERGLFFDFLFDYGSYGTFHFKDRSNPVLNQEDEQFWEEALHDTNVKKSGKDYFVSSIEQEKIFKKLISEGFLIKDLKNRYVVPFSQAKGSIEKENQLSSLKLDLEFSDKVASLDSIYEAISKNNPLIQLDDTHVGILPLSLLDELGILSSGFKKGNKCCFESFKKGDFNIKGVQLEDKTSICINELSFSHFKLKLLEFQKQGVSWLITTLNSFHGCLLADDMGLGKTVQTLALIDLMRNSLPRGVLIVCPKSIKYQWQQAIHEFLPAFDISFSIMSFHELRSISTLPSCSLVVIDEAQAIKNMKTQLFSKANMIRADYKLALTGTPIENSLLDLVSIFQFLNQSVTEDFEKMNVALNQNKIKRRLAPFILRRTKEDVLTDLPPLFEQTTEIEMGEEQARIYFELLQKAKNEPIHQFSLLTKLRQAAIDARLVDETVSESSSKTWQILEDIQSILSAGHKVILFSQFTSYLNLLEQHLKELSIEYAYIDGQTENRQEQIQDFKSTKSVLLMSLKAGGVGLNLQDADYVLIADPWWNEAAEKQAIDRAYRLGRKGAVVARKYVTAGSIEKKIIELKATKWALLDDLEKETSHKAIELLEMLFS